MPPSFYQTPATVVSPIVASILVNNHSFLEPASSLAKPDFHKGSYANKGYAQNVLLMQLAMLKPGLVNGFKLHFK